MKLALAGWSINRRFRAQNNPLRLLDFPKVAKEEFGFDAVELNSPFFESEDDAYLDRLLEQGKRLGVKFVGMAVDGTGDPSSLDEAARQDSVRQIKEWFPVSKKLGLPFFRANTGGRGNEENPDALKKCIESFTVLARVGQEYGVAIIIENHGGMSANPDNIVRIVQAVAKNVGGTQWIGTLPDFGNFADDIRYVGLEKIAKYAKAVHAKMTEFGPDGEDTRIDIGRCLKIFKDSGYDGYFGIEYEGKGDDHEGVIKSKELLIKKLN